jgi:hypothetical protein
MAKATEILQETVALGVAFLNCLYMWHIRVEMEKRASAIPSRAWINKFLADNSTLKLKTPELIEGQRYLFATTALLRRWFLSFHHCFLFRDPEFLYNADESMLAVGPGQEKVIVEERLS